MPYAPLPLVEAAADALKGKHPLAVLVLPAMLRAGVRTVQRAADGTAYGSTDELEVLRQYFTIPGADPDRPFRAIWEDNPRNFWRDERYAGRSFQRIRTDRVKEGKGLFQAKAIRGQDLWGFRPNAGQELRSYVREPVRLIDLAIWYGRDQDVNSLDELIDWFRSVFPTAQADLDGSIYSLDIPDYYRTIPLAPSPVSRSEYAEAFDAAPPPPSLQGSFSDFVSRIDRSVRDRGVHIPSGFIQRVITAWLRGDVVILVGPPGSGKTRFAHEIAQSLRAEFKDLETVFIPVRADLDESEVLGYQRLDGTPLLREVSTKIVQTSQPLSPHLIILEELNLTSLEVYLGSILTALQHPERRIVLPGGVNAKLPVDTFILGTCNSYIEEPETRVRISYPAKRRASVLSMPNVLADRYEAEGRQAVVQLTLDMIRQERVAIEARVNSGLAAALDGIRVAALAGVSTEDDLSIEVRTHLEGLARFLLRSGIGREFFTLGLLRDIALNLAYADRTSDTELVAFSQQVSDKILHQLRGPKTIADSFRGVVEGLPGFSEIDRALDRMKMGPGDQLLPII